MKKLKTLLTVLSLVITGVLFISACTLPFMEKPETPEIAAGQGVLLVSFSGINANPSLDGARTMLPVNPEFTRYELVVDSTPYSFYNNTVRLTLPDGSYTVIAKGYDGDVLVAQSESVSVTVSSGVLTPLTFTLTPYMEPSSSGLLSYSLSWDGLSRMPYRAELLIEKYADIDGTRFPDDSPIDPALILSSGLPAGSNPGTILLLLRNTAMINLAGSLELPAGEYRLTMSVTMDEGSLPVERTDLAHIYSKLNTPAAFFYGGGDLYVSNTAPDPGAGFITGFTFTQTPTATTVIGSEPGADGTRLIMVMVPSDTTLASLTPLVSTAPGASITSPLPASPSPVLGTDMPAYGPMDFTDPMVWTAVSKNGITQQYTVVVSKAPVNNDQKMITNFFFKEYPAIPANINQDAGGGIGEITVKLPFESSDPRGSLTPVVTIIGKTVEIDGELSPPNGVNTFSFTSAQTFQVYSESEPGANPKEYTVTVSVADNPARIITRFAIDGYPGRAVTSSLTEFGVIATGPIDGYYSITLTLPYGVSRAKLTPLVEYEGKTLEPLSGVQQNFNVPVYYTVTANDGDSKKYKVTIDNDGPDKNTGIFDFRITNWPNCKVVIGQKPRPDGKIPIVIQVPFPTDEENMIPEITLSSPLSSIIPASGVTMVFSGQEAVYTVTSQGNAATQKYVAVVSKGGEYYYVNGVSGQDGYPDYYNGESETYPFKTLAYAVYKAAHNSSIKGIFVRGELNDETEGGAWEKADVPWPDGFHGDNSDADADVKGSVFNLIGTNNKKITVTGLGNAVLRAKAANRRVLSVTGGANLVFENITITGGNAPSTSYDGNGGGVYVSGNSMVKFSGCSITGNKAVSGGGIYIYDTVSSYDSEVTLMNGTISGNTATGSATSLASMSGGGGVYIKGNALFWLSGGTIKDNTASHGAGGGVLVNGTHDHDPDGPGNDDPHDDGFLMSSGSIINNAAPNGVYPHGGGGVYVAQGTCDMLGGLITGNSSNRQGGGVFVYWKDALFIARGTSSITGNNGVGSSKGICNRGQTQLRDKAQADTVYIWDYGDASVPNQEFTLSTTARVGGIVLAHSAENLNFVEIVDNPPDVGTDQLCRIDLEGHLTGGLFKDFTPDADWEGKKLISGANPTLDSLINYNRIVLGTFTGNKTIYLTDYSIGVSGTNGTLIK
jgi:hypothetical protein